jgi:hypothetical protein
MPKIARIANNLDGFLGRIIYRVFGTGIALFAFGMLYAGASGFQDGGNAIAGAVFIGLSGGAFWLTRWMFSPSRRLSDMED